MIEIKTKRGGALTFDKDIHEYRLNGKLMLSVNQVLKKVGIVDESKFAFVKSEYREKGTDIHLLTELNDRGELDIGKVPEKYWGHLKQWNKWVVDNDVEIQEIELIVYDEDTFTAGTIDRVVRYDGMLHVLDLKTGKKVGKSVAIQLAGYKQMYEKMYGKEVGVMTLQLLEDKAVMKDDWPDKVPTWWASVEVARWDYDL